MRRTPSRHSYAALTALSLAICLSAAADAPVLSPNRAQAGQAGQVRLTAADREALASLLSCLTEAARDLTEQRPPQPGHAALSGAASRASTAPLPVSSASPGGYDDAAPPAPVAHRPELLNLPPPQRG